MRLNFVCVCVCVHLVIFSNSNASYYTKTREISLNYGRLRNVLGAIRRFSV